MKCSAGRRYPMIVNQLHVILEDGKTILSASPRCVPHPFPPFILFFVMLLFQSCGAFLRRFPLGLSQWQQKRKSARDLLRDGNLSWSVDTRGPHCVHSRHRENSAMGFKTLSASIVVMLRLPAALDRAGVLRCKVVEPNLIS
jgi:hypothetical protein